ncbi:MAG TPA: GntR family transcriptional regulator [Actinomycetales bacterium]|nr:GntR family transcriptional regulator [Actinomycetales bacterium]
MFDEGSPIFMQVAQTISNEILRGIYAEGDQIASTNEFAAFYKINPATAGKGINLLVDQGILFKRRGIGMFVADGARDRLLQDRKTNFNDNQLRDFVHAARAIGISLPELQSRIAQEYPNDQHRPTD